MNRNVVNESNGGIREENDVIVELSVKGEDKARADPDTEPEVNRDFGCVTESCLTLTNSWQLSIGSSIEIFTGDINVGAQSKVWDFNMMHREAEFMDDSREASGIEKKKGRKVRDHHTHDVQMTNMYVARSS